MRSVTTLAVAVKHRKRRSNGGLPVPPTTAVIFTGKPLIISGNAEAFLQRHVHNHPAVTHHCVSLPFFFERLRLTSPHL